MIPDTLTKDGAEKLVEVIQAYWRRRGLNPKMSIIKQEMPGHQACIHMIRSDMVGGVPRGANQVKNLAA